MSYTKIAPDNPLLDLIAPARAVANLLVLAAEDAGECPCCYEWVQGDEHPHHPDCPLAAMIAALAAGADDAPGTDQQEPGPTCLLCTGSGHGYPGAGPCPLETATLARRRVRRDQRGAVLMPAFPIEPTPGHRHLFPVPSLRIGRRTFTVNSPVRVRLRTTGEFVATLWEVRADRRTGRVVEVDVVGCPEGSCHSIFTVAPDRLRRLTRTQAADWCVRR